MVSAGMANVFEDIGLLEPARVSSTPRFWNVLYTQYKKLILLKSAERMREGEEEEMVVQEAQAEAMQDIRGILGRRISDISTGGAPTSVDVKQFLKECFGKKRVSEGYACTEAGQLADDDGTVYSNVKARIMDVPELGYMSTDKPFPRGVWTGQYNVKLVLIYQYVL
tara:strand:- start:596 stop:1096 length:501 start_codon:yes stop_codon:yes gene_type:complete